jgi:hypothetical protein
LRPEEGNREGRVVAHRERLAGWTPTGARRAPRRARRMRASRSLARPVKIEAATVSLRDLDQLPARRRPAPARSGAVTSEGR